MLLFKEDSPSKGATEKIKIPKEEQRIANKFYPALLQSSLNTSKKCGRADSAKPFRGHTV